MDGGGGEGGVGVRMRMGAMTVAETGRGEVVMVVPQQS